MNSRWVNFVEASGKVRLSYWSMRVVLEKLDAEWDVVFQWARGASWVKRHQWWEMYLTWRVKFWKFYKDIFVSVSLKKRLRVGSEMGVMGFLFPFPLGLLTPFWWGKWVWHWPEKDLELRLAGIAYLAYPNHKTMVVIGNWNRCC